MIQQDDYRLERIHAALLVRHLELQRLLDLKDETKPLDGNHGFRFLFVGEARARMEQEATFLANTLGMLDE